MSQLTVIPTSYPCEFDPANAVPTIAELAESAIQEKTCRHIAKVSLLPRDGTAYAILDSRCYARSGYQCNKRASESLFVLALRLSSGTHTLQAKMTIEATPTDSMQIGNSSGEKICREFVLHPTDSQDASEFHRQYPVSFRRTNEETAAAISISFSVRLDRPRWHSSELLALPVTLAPLNAQSTTPQAQGALLGGGSRKESSSVMDLFTSTVVGKSIELLMQEGWGFLKKVASGGMGQSDLIQLNIGDINIPNNAQEDLIVQAIRDSNLIITKLQSDTLEGLNNQLMGLSSSIKYLRSNLQDAVTIAEKADAETKIEKKTSEMVRIQEQIWSILQKTGKMDVRKKDLKVG